MFFFFAAFREDQISLHVYAAKDPWLSYTRRASYSVKTFCSKQLGCLLSSEEGSNHFKEECSCVCARMRACFCLRQRESEERERKNETDTQTDRHVVKEKETENIEREDCAH